jgi:hypothetical protein
MTDSHRQTAAPQVIGRREQHLLRTLIAEGFVNSDLDGYELNDPLAGDAAEKQAAIPVATYLDAVGEAIDVITLAPTDAWPMSDARLRRVVARTLCGLLAHWLESELSDDEFTRVTGKIAEVVARPDACGLALAKSAEFATAAATELLLALNAAREGP